ALGSQAAHPAIHGRWQQSPPPLRRGVLETQPGQHGTGQQATASGPAGSAQPVRHPQTRFAPLSGADLTPTHSPPRNDSGEGYLQEIPMIKNLAITPPIVGRISIGRVVEKNGKRLPEKDDQFTLTTQIQTRDGWLLHPLDEQLRKDA